MGHTTKLSDYEMERGDSRPVPDGVDIEASRAKSNVPKEHMSESEIRGDDLRDDVTTSKVIEPEKKTPSKTSTAKTKSK